MNYKDILNILSLPLLAIAASFIHAWWALCKNENFQPDTSDSIEYAYRIVRTIGCLLMGIALSCDSIGQELIRLRVSKTVLIRTFLIAKNLGVLSTGVIPLILMSLFEIVYPSVCFPVLALQIVLIETFFSKHGTKYSHFASKQNNLIDGLLFAIYTYFLYFWIDSAPFKDILIICSTVTLWAAIGIRNAIQGEVILREDQPPECETCYREFTEKFLKIPVILQCGHTICNECVIHLSVKYKNIPCPFCKFVTGEDERCPKNWALLHVIRQ
uniref:RING-type domain-containing protein n=1 Tax=Caenorhabditis tropicalis TaxID=1561998 RepID=A0A1I7THE4_9PELO